MTTAVQSPLSLSSRRVACARTSASHGGVAPSFLKRARASFACVCACVCLCPSLLSKRVGSVFLCVCVCVSQSVSLFFKGKGGFFCGVKKRVNNPSSLSFSSSIIKRFRFRLDFLLLRRANKNTRRNFFSLTSSKNALTHSYTFIGSTRKGKKKEPQEPPFFACITTKIERERERERENWRRHLEVVAKRRAPRFFSLRG